MSDGDKLKAHGSSVKDRQIRVFISSTFRDMQAERDYLVKFIFPQLRKLCESRGVTWDDVLPICPEEINRCRRFPDLNIP